MMTANPDFFMTSRRVLCCLTLLLTALASNITGVADESAAEPEMELVEKAIAAVGGEEKLLTLCRMEERYNAGKERVSPGTSRVSVSGKNMTERGTRRNVPCFAGLQESLGSSTKSWPSNV